VKLEFNFIIRVYLLAFTLFVVLNSDEKRVWFLSRNRRPTHRVMSDLPVPDFSSLDIFPAALALQSDVCSSAQPVSDISSVIGRFGFRLISPGPLRGTSNSSVYVAVDSMDHPCALKVSRHQQRLVMEYENRILLGDHESLVTSHDIYQHDLCILLQMELCEDGDILAQQLTEIECWKLITAVADGLQRIHEMECMHLDVSPSNIFRLDGKFKLGDFGTLRVVGDFRPGDEGAGPYAAPEVFAAPELVTGQADIFSLGVCLLEAASGFFAPRGGDQKYRALRQGKLGLGLDAYPCSYSPQLIQVVNRMLLPRPELRPTAALLVATGRWALRTMNVEL
jgi:serine/threonine protein kinase